MDYEINCASTFDEICDFLYKSLTLEGYYREDSETCEMRLYRYSEDEDNETEVEDFIENWFNKNAKEFLIQDFNVELVEAWSSVSLDIYVLYISWINGNNRIESTNDIIWYD